VAHKAKLGKAPTSALEATAGRIANWLCGLAALAAAATTWLLQRRRRLHLCFQSRVTGGAPLRSIVG